ncbi:MAG: hypothetical protein JXA38_00680 [Methanosarcinaceae archaeon]|nr:hypothetical protein [Methanosarcinaceae archaeon]
MSTDSLRRTKVTTVSLNYDLLNKTKRLVESGDYSSVSDVVSTALIKFFSEHDTEQITQELRDELPSLISEFLQSSDGQNLLISLLNEKVQWSGIIKSDKNNSNVRKSTSSSKNEQPIIVNHIDE